MKALGAFILVLTISSFAFANCEELKSLPWYSLKRIFSIFKASQCQSVVPERVKSCDRLTQQEFVHCLSNHALLSYALKTDPHLQKFFDEDADLTKIFYQNADYRRALNNISVLQLFEGDSGVSEGYTIAQHTVMALAIYEAQKDKYDIQSLKSPMIDDPDRFMKYVVAYHDIGKSIAVKTGDKSREMKYSHPIAWRLMLNSSFNQKQSHFAISLIQAHQIIGYYLMGRRTLQQSIAEVTAIARHIQMDPGYFYRFLEILYVADAGAYPSLRSRVFELQNEKLVIKSEKYKLLVQDILR